MSGGWKRMNEKHLEFIQGVINRMGNNSFTLKGLAVTLVTAIIGISWASGTPPRIIYLAILPVVTFWTLDAYYLRQERLFRELYKAAAKAKGESFSLDVTPYQKNVESWWRGMLSCTLFLFYGTLIAAIIIAILW